MVSNMLYVYKKNKTNELGNAGNSQKACLIVGKKLF